jgi:hypothetical protein
MRRVRTRRRHRLQAAKSSAHVTGRAWKRMRVRARRTNVYAATRSLERLLFNGVPGKIDGWGYP